MAINNEAAVIYLQSKSRFAQILELTVQSGYYSVVGREALSANGRTSGINGVFDVLNGTLVALYALNGKLILRVGDNIVPLNEEVSCSVSGDPANRLLTLTKNHSDLAQIRYDIRDSLRADDDPTPFIENEDSDFGLFIVNVLADATRRRVFLERW